VGEQQFQSGQYRQAAQLLRELILAPQFVEFLTLPAYERVS
jgi:malate synthase